MSLWIFSQNGNIWQNFMLNLISDLRLIKALVVKRLPEYISFRPIKSMRRWLVICVNWDIVLFLLLFDNFSVLFERFMKISLLNTHRLQSCPLSRYFFDRWLELAESLLHRLWAHTLLLPILILFNKELLLTLELMKNFLLVHLSEVQVLHSKAKRWLLIIWGNIILGLFAQILLTFSWHCASSVV